MTNTADREIAGLQDMASHFRALADHSDMLACIKDDKRRFVYVNKPFEDYFGVSLVALAGLTDIEGFPGEEAYAGIASPVVPKKVSICRHGEITDWVVTQFKYTDQHGRGFVGVLARDITLFQQLAAESKQFEAIIRSSSDAIVSKTLDGIITSWNPGAEALFAYAAEEMIGRSMLSLFPPERHDEEKLILQKVARGEVVHHYEAERIRKGGERIRVSVSISPVRSCDGSIVGASKIARDVTGRRRLEIDAQRLAAIVHSSEDAIISKSVEGTVLTWNRGAEKLFGYSEAEMLGQPMLRLFPPGRAEEERYILEQIMKGERVEHFETVRLRKDGTVIELSVTISPIRDTQGVIVAASTIARDISERKRMQVELAAHLAVVEEQVRTRTDELEHARQRAVAASVAKSVFLANMSHEIRTPMNAILGFTHLLERDCQEPSQLQKLQRIEASGKHLLGLLGDVLDLSKIESGQLTIEQTALDVSLLLDRVYSIMVGRADEKGLKLWHDIDTRLVGMPLLGDPLRLTQVLINFISNAIKFSSKGSIHVVARIDQESVHDVSVRFEVEDSGIGISREDQERIFDAFVQADASTTRRFGGTGLGLAISRLLARLMGGDAGVVSEQGKGSTFWLAIRLGRGDPAALDKETAVAAAGTIRAHARVLLVEDNLLNQEVARELLQRADLLVRIANNGGEAVSLVHAEEFDLVLMDMQMPVMDGLEATRQIRRIFGKQGLPIIAMTGNAFGEDRRKCLEAGMNDHLAKPVDPHLLYEKLAAWIPAPVDSLRSDIH
jgi:PAS domain S-box-containing protein